MIFLGQETSFYDEALQVGEDGIGTYTVSISRRDPWFPLPPIGCLRNSIPSIVSGMIGCELFELTGISQSKQNGFFTATLTFKGIYQSGVTLVMRVTPRSKRGLATRRVEGSENFFELSVLDGWVLGE